MKEKIQKLIEEYSEDATFTGKISSDDIIENAIKESNATTIKDLGNVMKVATPKLKNKCDMKKVTTLIKDKLSN